MGIRFAVHEGVRIAYDEQGGNAPPLVFIHGYRMRGALWEPVCRRLSHCYRTLLVDLRGNGASERPPRGYGLEEFAGDVLAVLKDAGLSQAVMVGHSMGGTVAEYLMAYHPDSVTAAILVAPVPPSGVEMPEAVLSVFRRSITEEPVLRNLYQGSVARPEVIDDLCALSRTADPRAAYESLDAWRLARFADRFDGCPIPALVVAGAEDHFFPEDFLRREVLARLKHGRLTVVSSAGHFIPREQPERLAGLIQEFVDELLRPTGS
ncbi:MAG: alpha/beta hydrolase [Firmicutes bacterium]|nr:alpha/beta hydrolase [Alicyclobacillaceae bacterium]MCL6497874.1 alpha/beta hydrolase [Bacillota bacterium]